jgi:hypothetical protein
MNCNTSASVIIAARIQAGIYKPKDNKEAMKELLMAIDISYQAFLNISGNGGASHLASQNFGGPSAEDVLSVSPPSKITSFKMDNTADASPASPKKSKQDKIESKWVCSECASPVSTKVWEFSNDRYGRTLCFGCQEKERSRIEDATGPRDLMK